MPSELSVGQTGGLSSTANLAYGLRASDERLRPQPSRPAPAAAPPAAAVVEEASTIIQAAARSRGVRRDAERSEKWLGDLTRSSAKLDAKALGELGDGKRSIPGPLLGVAGRTQFARAAEEKIAAERAKTLAESNPGRSARKARSGPGGTGIGLRGAVGAVRAANAFSKSSSSSTSQGMKTFRKANIDFVKEGILGPLIDRAARLGEGILAARVRQAEFESRLLPKPVCVASLFGTAVATGDAHSSLAFLEQDGLGVLASRAELLQLSMHTCPLPQLGLQPLVRQTAQQASELPTTAPIHSVCVDAATARVFALHTDGVMLVWGARHGELRHSAPLLPPPAMQSAPTEPLIAVDEESQLLLFDCSWHDGTVRVLEPLSLDTLSSVSVALPGEPPGTRRVAHLAYIELVQLLLLSLEGSAAVLAFDAGSGALRAELGGHLGAPPRLQWLLRLQRLATLGGGTPPFGDASAGGDCSVRVWSLTPRRANPPPNDYFAEVQRRAAAKREAEGKRGDPSGVGDGPPAIEVVCERVLTGHTAAVTDVTFLPDSALLVTSAMDCSVRFWDVDAMPHPLTAPEGGAHVRVGPGRYEPMRPEWTVTNPPYVNCLVIHTAEPPLRLGVVTGWRGPEGLLVLTARGTPFKGKAVVGPPSSNSPPPGGHLALWAVTRALLQIEAARFDEILDKDTYATLEATAAKDWRAALLRLRAAEAGLGDVVANARRTHDSARTARMELLRHASLHRASLADSLDESLLRQVQLISMDCDGLRWSTIEYD